MTSPTARQSKSGRLSTDAGARVPANVPPLVDLSRISSAYSGQLGASNENWYPASKPSRPLSTASSVQYRTAEDMGVLAAVLQKIHREDPSGMHDPMAALVLATVSGEDEDEEENADEEKANDQQREDEGKQLSTENASPLGASVSRSTSERRKLLSSRQSSGRSRKSSARMLVSREASSSVRSSFSIITQARRRATLTGKRVQNRDLKSSFAPGVSNDEDYPQKEAILDMQREALSCILMESITRFWKSVDHPAWRSSPKELLFKRFSEITKFKREACCLNVEVENWIFRHKILHVTPKEYEESPEERHFRRSAFWAEWRDQHDYARKLDVPEVWRPHGAAMQPKGVQHVPRALSGTLSPKAGGGPSRPSSRQMHALLQAKAFNTDKCSQAFGNPAERAQQRQDLREQVMKAGRSPNLLPQIKGKEPAGKYRQKRPPMSASNPHLPPIETVVKEPWKSLEVRRGSYLKLRRASTQAYIVPDIEGAEASSTRSYFRECDYIGIMPRLLPMVTGHTGRLVGADRGFNDLDLQALAMMVGSMEEVEEVDLSGNIALTDSGLASLLRNLFGRHSTATFTSLDLRRCTGAGRGTLAGIAMLLGDKEAGARSLKHLNLSSIKLPTLGCFALCQAIGRHPHLVSVCLADTGLGEKLNAGDCVEAVVGCRTLDSLDLSWNSFITEVFNRLGVMLGSGTKLRKLSLANTNSMQVGNVDMPLTFFLEHLKDNNSLTQLDVAMNGLNFRGALILEDSLEKHPTMRELELSENPLGNLGMRSLVRLLSRDTTSLLYFGSANCNDGAANEGTDGAQLFNPCNPNGRYTLKLERPYHRAILRMLHKRCEKLGLTPEQAFVDISYSRPPYSHPDLVDGIWQVESKGHLSLTFTTERAEAGALNGVEDSNFTQFLDEHYKLLKLTPGFKKIVPLFAWWKLISDRTKDLLVLLSALAKDFIITYPQMEQLCRNRFIKADSIYQLLHCVDGGVMARYLTVLLTPSLREYLGNRRRMKNFLLFSVENPSGHYRLDLENCSDYAVAERLFLLDRWECGTCEKKGRINVSQTRYRSQIRNGSWQEIALPANIADFHLPESGILEFDYASCKRPPEDAQPLDMETFTFFMTVLQDTATAVLPPEDVIDVLRTISQNFYLNSRQNREILGLFKHAEDRAELFVIFFLRIVDMVNEKIFRVRFDNPEELLKLRRRLGHVMCFPFIQPEGQQYDFQLKHFDSRLCLNILINLNFKEKVSNITQFEYVDENGVVDPLPLGIPNSWRLFEKMPKGGTFKCIYVCAPEDRNLKYRLEMLQTYGYWSYPNLTTDDIMWWSGLSEAPSDVIDYLEFLMSRYSNIYKPFRIIDGPGGNGQITLREFEDGIKAMHCTKFNGPDKQKRMESVFRYLDPGNEGQVSLEEWGLLENLWKEMRLSINEFVMFLQRKFGIPEQDKGFEFLDRAWEFLDDDGSGEITEEEWHVALEENLMYFGNARTIFAFLDKDEEGTVSPEEFSALQALMKDDDQHMSARTFPDSANLSARFSGRTTQRSQTHTLSQTNASALPSERNTQRSQTQILSQKTER